jgi:hypothetical protein
MIHKGEIGWQQISAIYRHFPADRRERDGNLSLFRRPSHCDVSLSL